MSDKKSPPPKDGIARYDENGNRLFDEDMQFHATVDNETGQNLSKTSDNLDHGKWDGSPPATIGDNSTGSFAAQGTEGSWVGTEGNVVYQAFDGTKFTINWDIPYSGANSGGISCDDGGTGKCSQYTMTADPSSFPTGGDSVTVAYKVERNN